MRSLLIGIALLAAACNQTQSMGDGGAQAMDGGGGKIDGATGGAMDGSATDSAVASEVDDHEWMLWVATPDSPLLGSYTVGNGTVSDAVTGLTWQQATGAKSDWATAKSYCQTLNLGGFASGWRLPTKIELQSIVDYAAKSSPSINTSAFPGTQATVYWASSPFTPDLHNVWAVFFDEGNTTVEDKTSMNLVRCVR